MALLKANTGIGTTNPISALHVIGDELVTGVVTATTFNGQINAGVSTLGIATATNLTLQQLRVSGISTLGITTATNLTAQQLNVSGLSTFAGITTVTGETLFANQLSVSGVGTIPTLSGTTATYTTINGINAYVNVGVVTTLSGINLNYSGISTLGVTSATDLTSQQLRVSGISTLGITSATNLTAQSVNSSGIVTGSSFRPSSGYYQSPNGTNAFYVYDGTGNVAFQGTIGASQVNNASGFKVIGFAGTNITFENDARVGNNLYVVGVSTLGITTVTNLTAQQLSVAGVVTAPTFVGNLTGTATTATKLENSRTFEITGDVVASPISFDGTGNVSLAATIQPNSVGLGTDTFGDYVKDISGTSNQITVTGGTGEGSTPTLSLPTNLVVPQDLTVTRDLQVNRNLNVTGNITIGGTSATIFSQSLNIFDPDIVLGYRTDALGNDVSNDNTANHGGVAVASTEGTPLVQLFIAGIETNPATYKKIMWFKEGTFSGLGTDAWLSNYAIGIGSTQFPTGTRLAAGSVQFTERDLAVVRNINASGVITATNGFAGTATSTTNIPNLTGDVTSVNTVTTLATVNSNVGTYGDAGAIPSITVNAKGLVTGVTTVAPNNGQLSLAVSGIGLTGSASFTANQSGSSTFTVTSNATSANTASAIVARDASGDFSAGTITATLSGNASSATYATTAGISTSVIGGIASVTQLSVSGVSTFNSNVIIPSSSVGIGTTNPLQRLQVGTANTLGINTNGTVFVVTSNADVGIGTTNPTSKLHVLGDARIVGTITATTFVGALTGTATTATNVIGGIGSITQLQVTGISTFTNGPVFIGAATSTGTLDQDLQVTGGAYVSGNLGIGTTNPTSKLHVLGDARIVGTITATTFVGALTGTATSTTNIPNLTGDITSVNTVTSIAAGVIVDADINASAGIVDTKLATISTALKVSNSATTATNANTASAIVARDASGNFSAGTITATLTGNASSATFATTAGVSTSVIGGIGSVTQLSVSGVSTFNSNVLIPSSSIGIGTTNPLQRLQVGTANTLGINTTGTVFVVTSNADVGIGTTNPTSKLHVLGDARIVGTITATTFVGALTGTATTAGISTNLKGGLTGNIPYQSAPDTTVFLANGTIGQVLQSNGVGNAPSWVNAAANGITIRDEGNIVGGANSVTTLNFVGNNVSAASTAGIATITFADYVSVSGFATNAGISTNLKGGAVGNIPYQSAADTTVFLTNGSSGTILQSNGVGNAPSWVSAAPSNAITGLTIRDEGTLVGGANSVTTLDFKGLNVSVASTAGIATITIADNLVGTALSISGLSTFSNNVYVGSAITFYAATGIISATAFYGNGQNLTDIITGKIEGIGIFNEGSIVGTSRSFTGLNFIGDYVTATGVGTTANITFSAPGFATTAGVSTSVIGGIGSITQLQVTGVSTFTNGPIIIGSGTSTGTTTQRLQVTGGAYISESVGIGTTNPLQTLHVQGNLLVAAGSSTGQHITQKAYELNSGTLSWEGSAGQLFSITNNLTSGSIFSVNDVSGIPSIDVNADGTVTLAPYADGNVGIATTRPTSRLHVIGNGLIVGVLTATSFSGNASSATFATTAGISTSVIGGIASVTQLSVSGISTFQSSNLKIRNPADTFEYSIAGDAIGANYTLTLPVVTSNTGIAVTGLSQTFTGTQTFTSTLSASDTLDLTGSSTGTHLFGTNQTSGTLTFGGTSGTGTITLGRAATSQQTDIQAGATAPGNVKTINFGTAGRSGSFTQINIGPTAGVGTVVINSGTNLGIGSATPTSKLDVLGNSIFTGILTARNAATQDSISLNGRAGGTSSFNLSLTPTTLAASRTVTFQDITGTVYVSGGTDVTLADGGTNASLTASNGGIVYSTATAMAILSGTATAGQMLRSGASGAPSWSTATFPNTATTAGTILRADGTNWAATSATYPTTTTINQILYSSAANTISGITAANTSALVTSSTGVPSLTSGTTANRLLRTDGTTVSFAQAVLTSDVSGTLPIANGGTNSTASPTNGGISYGTGSAFAFTAAGTSGQVLISTGAAAPVWSSNLNISGISTFTNGPVFIGAATSTGTLDQDLQVTGGAYVSGNLGIGTTNPTSKLHVLGSGLITGISTIANLRITPVGTGATVGGIGVTYYGDGSQLTGISAGGSGDGSDFNTGITTTVYYSPGVAATSYPLTGIGISFPSTANREYLIESIHVTNVVANDMYVTAEIDYSGGAIVPLTNRILVPYQGSLEIIDEPLITNPLDKIRFLAYTGIGTTAGTRANALDCFITYATKTGTDYIGTGATITQTIAGVGYAQTVFTSTTYPSIINTIVLTNYSNFVDVEASVFMRRGGTVQQGYFVYNLTVPQNSSVQILPKAKRLNATDTIVVNASQANTLSVNIAGKYVTS